MKNNFNTILLSVPNDTPVDRAAVDIPYSKSGHNTVLVVSHSPNLRYQEFWQKLSCNLIIVTHNPDGTSLHYFTVILIHTVSFTRFFIKLFHQEGSRNFLSVEFLQIVDAEDTNLNNEPFDSADKKCPQLLKSIFDECAYKSGSN